MGQLLKSISGIDPTSPSAERCMPDHLRSLCLDVNRSVGLRLHQVIDQLDHLDDRTRSHLSDAVITKHDYDRALFVRLGGEFAGATKPCPVEALSAVEFNYAADTALDDIADAGTVRHGKPCLHRRAGVHVAMYMVELLRSLGRLEFLAAIRASDLSQDAASQLLSKRELANFALNYGQILDIAPVRPCPEQYTDDDYFHMISNGTGADVAFCFRAGAELSRAPSEVCETAEAFGHEIGILLQLRDDLLDYSTDEQAIDKPSGADIEQRRMRLPLIHACRVSDKARTAFAARGPHQVLREAVLATDAVSYARHVALSRRNALLDAVTLARIGGPIRESIDWILREVLVPNMPPSTGFARTVRTA